MEDTINSQEVKKLMLFLNRESEKGQGLVEYALILVLVVIVVIVILMILGPQIQEWWETVGKQIIPALGG